MASESEPSGRLVVVGSSAGGIEALGALLASLPKDFPAPLVIAQHIDPHRPSHLAEVLGRHSTLPVRTISSREALQPGTVFVVPSNRHVEITDHEVALSQEGGSPMPSVDRLFSSAAAIFGDGLIAVILSGTGSDGAAGAHYVKQAGGTVIIQNPDTASYPGMPQSLAPTTVDIVANLDRIGPLLSDLLLGIPVPERPESYQTIERLLEQLQERSGIDFTAYKRPTIERRLQRRMAATETRTPEDYMSYLDTHQEESQRLISSFLIKVTEFFRDPDLFACLSQQILPDVIDRARKENHEIRIWSAGCATGEEAYSLAILLCQALGDSLEEFQIRIFATDLDDEAITFARRGIYGAAALRSLSPEMLSRYFVEEDGEYAVRKRVRSLMVFGQHDLGQRAPFPHIDLVLCRNVLIYFTGDLQKRALQLFAFSLRDAGYLVLGKAETSSPLPEYFQPYNALLKIYRRYGERFLIPPGQPRAMAPGMSRDVRRRLPATGGRKLAQPAQAVSGRRLLADQVDDILLHLPAGVVVIDPKYDIQQINLVARRLLGIHGAAIGEDFIHLVDRISPHALRRAIDKAFRDGSLTTLTDLPVPDVEPSSPRFLELICSPFSPVGAAGSPPALVSILVTDVTARVAQLAAARESAEHERGGIQASMVEERRQREALAARVQMLTERSEDLLRSNEELTAANAELRNANEDFLVDNEEVQASSEEVETLNEELQATNEELETLNEELQATVEELNTTNEDLASQSAELQELAQAREDQRGQAEEARAWLQLILASMPVALLVVDAEAQAMLLNDAYKQIFGQDVTGLQALAADGSPLPPDQTPQWLAARGESFEMKFEGVDKDGKRQWFEATGSPLAAPLGGDEHGGGLLLIRKMNNHK